MKLSLAILSMMSCVLISEIDVPDTAKRAYERADINNMYAQLEAFTGQLRCTDEEDWDWVAVGSAACGGPVKYLAFQRRANNELFFSIIAQLRAKEEQFNTKWGIMSICIVPPKPVAVKCINDQPVFLY